MTRRLLALIAASLPAPAFAQAFDCVIDPAVVVDVGSPVTGILAEVTVERGARVKRGEEIARLRTEMEDAAIALYELQAASEEEILASRSRLDLARSRQERVTELAERGVATAEQLDEVNAAVEVATRELASAHLRQQVLALELGRARTARDQRIILSPIDGIVVERSRYRGELVNQDTHVATIARLDPLFVEAYLPVEMYPSIEVGLVAEVRPHPPIGGAYSAEVVAVDQVFDPASGTFGVRLALPNPESRLPAGHRCDVEFDGGGG